MNTQLIKEIRRYLNLSYSDVANALECSPQNVKLVESRRLAPSERLISFYAERLNVATSTLMELVYPKKETKLHSTFSRFIARYLRFVNCLKA